MGSDSGLGALDEGGDAWELRADLLICTPALGCREIRQMSKGRKQLIISVQKNYMLGLERWPSD